MRRKLAKLRNEAAQILATYETHKDSEDERIRRKVHLDVDRFLMENRETALLLLINGLNQELNNYKEPVKAPWYRRLMPNVNR